MVPHLYVVSYAHHDVEQVCKGEVQDEHHGAGREEGELGLVLTPYVGDGKEG